MPGSAGLGSVPMRLPQTSEDDYDEEEEPETQVSDYDEEEPETQVSDYGYESQSQPSLPGVSPTEPGASPASAPPTLSPPTSVPVADLPVPVDVLGSGTEVGVAEMRDSTYTDLSADSTLDTTSLSLQAKLMARSPLSTESKAITPDQTRQLPTDDSPQIELAPPQIEQAPPQIELAPPQIELVPPQIKLVPPQIKLAPSQIELAPPQIELAPPQVEPAPTTSLPSGSPVSLVTSTAQPLLTSQATPSTAETATTPSSSLEQCSVDSGVSLEFSSTPEWPSQSADEAHVTVSMATSNGITTVTTKVGPVAESGSLVPSLMPPLVSPSPRAAVGGAAMMPRVPPAAVHQTPLIVTSDLAPVTDPKLFMFDSKHSVPGSDANLLLSDSGVSMPVSGASTELDLVEEMEISRGAGEMHMGEVEGRRGEVKMGEVEGREGEGVTGSAIPAHLPESMTMEQIHARVAALFPGFSPHKILRFSSLIPTRPSSRPHVWKEAKKPLKKPHKSGREEGSSAVLKLNVNFTPPPEMCMSDDEVCAHARVRVRFTARTTARSRPR